MSSQATALFSPFPPLPQYRAPRETPKAAAAFHAYCLLGPGRSLSQLAASDQMYTKRIPQLKRWSSTLNWQERVKEYDAAQAAEHRKKRLAAIEKMDEEHALVGRVQLLRAADLINYLLYPPEPAVPGKKQIQPQPDANVTLSSAVSLMRAAAELERLARGAATERVEGELTVAVLPKEYVGIDPSEEGSDL